MGTKRAKMIWNDIVCACISIKRSVCDMHALYRKILTEKKLNTCESPTTLDMRSRRIRDGNTQQRCLCASSFCIREVFMEAFSSRNFQSRTAEFCSRSFFGCVTKNAQTQCQCVGSKFIASKMQETHSRRNTVYYVTCAY